MCVIFSVIRMIAIVGIIVCAVIALVLDTDRSTRAADRHTVSVLISRTRSRCGKCCASGSFCLELHRSGRLCVSTSVASDRHGHGSAIGTGRIGCGTKRENARRIGHIDGSRHAGRNRDRYGNRISDLNRRRTYSERQAARLRLCIRNHHTTKHQNDCKKRGQKAISTFLSIIVMFYHRYFFHTSMPFFCLLFDR